MKKLSNVCDYCSGMSCFKLKWINFSNKGKKLKFKFVCNICHKETEWEVNCEDVYEDTSINA